MRLYGGYMIEDDIKDLVIEGFTGWFICPYCGKLHLENTMCCKEVHCIEIK
jgi:hypothetical protein